MARGFFGQGMGRPRHDVEQKYCKTCNVLLVRDYTFYDFRIGRYRLESIQNFKSRRYCDVDCKQASPTKYEFRTGVRFNWGTDDAAQRFKRQQNRLKLPYNRQWREENRDKVNQANAKWRGENPEKYKAILVKAMKKYYEANKEKLKAYQKKYYKTHKAELKATRTKKKKQSTEGSPT